jgi:hydroxyquinol 1,2-dioxygenase
MELTAMNPDLTGQVVERINSDDARFTELMTSLVVHLHAFVRQTRPSEDEWLRAVDFLVATGAACDEYRNEFMLLSDMLGVTSLVDEINHQGPANMTPSSVEGPFHSPAPRREPGAVIAGGPEWERAERVVVHGTVTDCDGRPVPGAELDVWQSDDTGLYDSQDPEQEMGNLRGLFTTDAEGHYWFRTVRPSSYPVPTDGPVGDLLRAMGRHPMRPAHIHIKVKASGHRPLTTHVFLAEDPYLDSDAAFAVQEALVVPVTPLTADVASRLGAEPTGWGRLPVDIRLVATNAVENS